LSVKTLRIKPFSFSKTRLNISVTEKESLDGSKQQIALMPNLIHSLDASSMSQLFHRFHEIYPENHNFYAIHDCFATTSDKITNLIRLLKDVYLSIYSDEQYLLEFDIGIINNILNHYKDEII